MFHRPKPRQFNYRPIYSDNVQKEEKKLIKEKSSSFSIRFHDQNEKSSRIIFKKRRLNISIYIIIVLLLLYFIFFR